MRTSRKKQRHDVSVDKTEVLDLHVLAAAPWCIFVLRWHSGRPVGLLYLAVEKETAFIRYSS